MKYRNDSPANGDSKSSTAGAPTSSVDRTSTASFGGAAAASPRPKSRSGIFDLSPTTDIKSPVALFGSRAAASTQNSARSNTQSDSMKADLFRALFAAIAIPVTALLIFLEYGGAQRLQPGIFTAASDLMTSNQFLRTSVNAAKSASPMSELPPVTPVQFNVASEQVDIGKTILPPTPKPHPFNFTLDVNGHLIEPFAFELDENGLEISRVDAADHLATLPPILAEEFRSIPSITKLQVPPTFAAITTGTHPFLYSPNERSRLLQLRDSNPEIGKALTLASSTTTERLRIPPLAIESFNVPHSQTKAQILTDARRDLTWIRSAATVANLSGDKMVEKRIVEILLLWAKTYRPAGFATIDRPLFDLLYGYDFVRPGLDSKDRKVLDEFFRDVVDRQFSQVRAMKEYGLEHALHVAFAATVAFVTEDRALQYYATAQYRAHVENPRLLTLSTFGLDEVQTTRALLQIAFVMERSGSSNYKNDNLNRLITAMVESAQDDPAILSALGIAAYFRPELLTQSAVAASTTLSTASQAGAPTTVFLAILRKPTSNLLPNLAPVRLPASAKPRPLPKPRSKTT